MDEKRMVIRVNNNAKMSRGKQAAQAVHAALMLVGAHHGGPVVVLGSNLKGVKEMEVYVQDIGRTEVEPGTVTAGAGWNVEESKFEQLTLWE